MRFYCGDENRRNAILKLNGQVNGIDYLEVEEEQLSLVVYFLKPVAGDIEPDKDSVDILGGERIRDLRVVDMRLENENQSLKITVDKPGDFSTYTLSLKNIAPLNNFDVMLSRIDFSFKVNCPSNLDCRTETVCSETRPYSPDINYLAKDYESFRQLMLDRIATLMPDWNERNAADLGITLVELLAYVGDYLSYQQDAIATEAYFETARKRVSVKRHARLLDYYMHDGCNARVLVQINVNADNVEVPVETPLLTHVTALKGQTVVPPESDEYHKAMAANPEVFETLHKATLFTGHKEICFYTWGATDCCLPKGATQATLAGEYPNLKKGDILIFIEQYDPSTHKRQDANVSHRHAVRLIKDAETIEDPLGGSFLKRNQHNGPETVTTIEWGVEDALPFPLCISHIPQEENDNNQFPKTVSVALGNIVLANHGQSVQEKITFEVGKRFRLKPQFGPLTNSVEFTSESSASATAIMQFDHRQAMPSISMFHEDQPNNKWIPEKDLINSTATDGQHFVVEMESDEEVYLRFDDGTYGKQPELNKTYTFDYRIGNGKRGNVSIGSIGHIVMVSGQIIGVDNPLPAVGGVEPETIQQVRRDAPQAFQTQERAVTTEDYATIASNLPGIQRAAASSRWTGSWKTIFLTIDPEGTEETREALEQWVRNRMEPYRMAGHDLEVESARYVPLEVQMKVCVKEGFFRDEVRAALLNKFNNRTLPDEHRGIFHPDNFTFGQPVYLSPLYAAAQETAGVDYTEITCFRRKWQPEVSGADSGKLEMNRLEIAQLDNDPNYPERGTFDLIMEGGK